MKCQKRQSKVDAIFCRTFHTYPICLPNLNFGKEGGDDGEVKMLYPKRNWENYQILYSLKVGQLSNARCTIHPLHNLPIS